MMHRKCYADHVVRTNGVNTITTLELYHLFLKKKSPLPFN